MIDYMKIKDLFIYENGEDKLNWELIDTIEEFKRLKEVPQSNKWHQEGNVYNHTKLVVEEMIGQLDIFGVETTSEHYHMMIAAALCHDLGKYGTTYFDETKNDYGCRNHGLASAQIVKVLFADEEQETLDKLCSMVRWHMDLHHILECGNPLEKMQKLINKCIVDIDDMVVLNYCDSKGSINEQTELDIVAKINKINDLILKL